MKTVYFIRHAKSSWNDFSLADHDRPLNERGKRDAPFMGQKLKEAGIVPDLVLSSTAKRAYTTAKHICKVLDYPTKKIEATERIYEASMNNILYLLTEVEDKHEVVFLFGHNPTMTALANYFGPKKFIPNMPTCGIVQVDFDVNNWHEIDQSNGKAGIFIFPKMYL